MATTLYGDISPRTAVVAAKRFLRVAQPLLVTQRFGQMETMGQGTGGTLKWRRYNSLAVTSAPLAEGVTPTAAKLTYSDVQAVLQQYGAVLELTDVIADTHEDPVLKTMSERSGEQAARVIEEVTLDVLKAGTNVFYAAGVASRDLVNTAFSRSDLRRIERSLRRTNASTYTKIVKATPDVGTRPVAEAFWGLMHTDLIPDLQNVTGFLPADEYADANQRVDGEVGKVGSIRFIATANGSNESGKGLNAWHTAGAAGTTFLNVGITPGSSLAADVYPVLIIARDAYGCVKLQGKDAVTMTVLNPNVPRGGDPLGQKGSVGWKTYYSCAILNDSWITRYEVACTASPS
jgi:N4-gp56 family major capsid protein